MREGWKEQSLADACQFINGLWKGKVEPFIPVGVIRNTNFTKDGRLDDSDIAYLDVEAKQYSKRRLKYGDIILEKSGGGPKQPVGRVVFFDKKEGNFSFSNFTSAIRVKEPNILDSAYLHKYLFWVYLSGRTESMQSHSTGIRNLNSDAYKAINIPVPPLPEQRRIVAILDEAFEGIATAKANAEKNLQNAREVFESYLNAVFSQRGEGWVEKPLGEITRFIDYRGRTPKKTENGLRLITAKNIKMGYLQSNPIEFVAPDTYETWMTRGIPKMGDVLFTTEAPLANIAQLNTKEKVVFAQRIIIMQPDLQNINGTFLKYSLMSQTVQSKIQAMGTGATVKGIKARLLKTIKISFPSLHKQMHINEILGCLQEKTQQLESIYTRKLLALDKLNRSFIREIFSGDM